MEKSKKGIFITGTGTDVGKTYVTALLTKKMVSNGLSTIYYKAALSGAEFSENGELVESDANYVCDIAGIEADPKSLISYIYKTPISPHLAAEIEGNPAKISKIIEDFNSLKNNYDYIVAEGSGGIICPIAYDSENGLDNGGNRNCEANNRDDNRKLIMLEDIIKSLNLKVLIVADAGLGTINHTVMTAEYIKNNGMEAVGIILNNYDDSGEKRTMHIDNLKIIERITGLPVVAKVKKDDKELDIEIDKLIKLFGDV